ncbi:MAG: SIR2 family protein [Tepidisphaeraceae bacterium]
MSYNILRQSELLERIGQQVGSTVERQPPFTLVLGSGFSYGIIPTTAEIVRRDLSWWKWCQRHETGGPTPKEFFDQIKSRDDDEAKKEAKAFWERVHKAQHATSKEKFELDGQGVVTDATLGEAYRFALSSACTPGLNTPHEVRRYFGDMIRRAGNRLNPAHLFLASIIAERRTRRLFGTIFTTNFDPLLQRSLQLVNAPYFVSDRPETLQYPDDDDIADAVHLIHAHGSIYRYLLLNSPAEIEKFALANQSKLQEYFRKHAVLIIGFSGWDDAITRALRTVDQFDHNLYWCDRSADPDKSSLTPEARDLLKKHANAFYVQIKSADDLMVQTHRELIGHALPRVFREPILTSRDQLDLCDLSGVKVSPPTTPTTTSSPGDKAEEFDLGLEVEAVRKNLDAAQDLFIGKTVTNKAAMLAAEVRQRLSTASDLFLSGKYAEAIPHFDFVLANAGTLDSQARAATTFRRGVAYSERRQEGDLERSIADFSAVIDMPGVSRELKVRATVNRSAVYAERGEPQDLQLSTDDCDTVINMPDASPDQKAKALTNRGINFGKRASEGDSDRELNDYTAVIQMEDVPADDKATAYHNRAVFYLERGKPGDIELARSDANAAMRIPEVSDAVIRSAQRILDIAAEREAPTRPGPETSPS